MIIDHKKNTAFELVIAVIDSAAPADFKTGLSPTDTAYYKDGGAWTSLAITDTFSEIGSTGMYALSLTASELNHDWVVIKITGTGGAASYVEFRMGAIGIDDLVRSATPANALSVDANGRIDIGKWLGTVVTNGATSGKPEVDAKAISDSTTAADNVQANIGNLDAAVSSRSTLTAAQVNSEVDSALDTPIPGTPTAGSVNDGVKKVEGRLTQTRAGYLDKLNITGNVASSGEVTAIQNNTRVRVIVPTTCERPDAGSTAYKLHLYIYDEAGNMEAPDSTPTVTAENEAGTDRSGNLGTVTLEDTGHYSVTYTVAAGHAIEQIHIEWTVTEGSVAREHGAMMQIVDTTAVDFTSADRTKLDGVYNKLPTGDLVDSADVNTELDNALNTAIPGSPTADSINQRVKALDELLEASGSGDAAAIKAKTDNLPSDPADQSLIIAATDAILNRLPAALVGGRMDSSVGDIVAAALAKFFTTASGQTYATSVAQSVVKEIADNAGGGGETQLRTGTAQGGSASTITLDAGASGTNDYYKHCICAITGGTGAGQAQIIDSYVGATKVATMAANWATAPDNTSEFVLLPLGTIPGASAPTAAQVADAVLAELIADHKATGGSLADVVNRIRAATIGKKIISDKNNGTIKIYDEDGTTLLRTLTIQDGPTDDEVQLVGS